MAMPIVVSTRDIREGMILAEPVVNSYGQALLPAGIKLESKHVRILKTWNINTVLIKTDESEEEIEISEELLGFAEEILLKRMNWRPRNLIERDLYNNALRLIARSLLKHAGEL